ncbi:MerR family transcriptional regulator [Allorhizocola rhizosphaerae]|uniref:MerR family transcriptional regulator n=1 Tax=Allorhizocola rhizosphaerae TaxID=1872709 RepID=UPI000E3E2816|nr:MerR family transcriptional regulator [Allorhizocola rhizosphaerae]
MELLTIGAFARAAKLTAKALRLYDELGLLPPAAVDPESGYRLYHPGQLERARLIARLRRIGMPLAEIATVCGLEPAAAAEAISAFWGRVTAETAARQRLASVLVEDLTGQVSTMDVRYAARCDKGAVRDSNEDTAHASRRLLAVADGMRGPGGAAASSAAVDALKPLELAEIPATELLAKLAEAVAAVDTALRAATVDDQQPFTTLTAMLRAGSQLALVHVGDSRAYVWRGGELFQLTHDHTYVQTLVDQGRLTREEAVAHPQRPLLARALGAGGQPVEVDLALRTALPGDRYLLCSDGLSAFVDRDSIAATLTEPVEPDQVVQKLIDLAYAQGAPDNIACAVADFA